MIAVYFLHISQADSLIKFFLNQSIGIGVKRMDYS